MPRLTVELAAGPVPFRERVRGCIRRPCRRRPEADRATRRRSPSCATRRTRADSTSSCAARSCRSGSSAIRRIRSREAGCSTLARLVVERVPHNPRLAGTTAGDLCSEVVEPSRRRGHRDRAQPRRRRRVRRRVSDVLVGVAYPARSTSPSSATRLGSPTIARPSTIASTSSTMSRRRHRQRCRAQTGPATLLLFDGDVAMAVDHRRPLRRVSRRRSHHDAREIALARGVARHRSCSRASDHLTAASPACRLAVGPGVGEQLRGCRAAAAAAPWCARRQA